MAEETNISWADRTWSPWYGCTQVSMGPQGACVGCYARQISETRMGRVVFGGPGRGIGTRDARADSAWKDPIRWNRTSPGDFVFPSMCDPFDNHPDLFELRARFFNLIRDTPNLTWLLLTKRPGNIVKLWDEVRHATGLDVWPSNAAIGCTVVTQAEADRDIPDLLLAKRDLEPAFAFVSMEPLLGAVDLTKLSTMAFRRAEVLNALTGELSGMFGDPAGYAPALDWVIAGGETDQGAHKARPSSLQWYRELRDQCAGVGVPFHFKQWGEWAPARLYPSETPGRFAFGDYSHDRKVMHQTDRYPRQFTRFGARAVMERVGKKAAGNLLDGVLHDARPEARHG